MNQIGKIKSQLGEIVAGWMIFGFIFGNVLAVVFWVIGLDSLIIIQFYLIAVISPIGVNLIWFGLVDKDEDPKSYLYGKRSSV